MYYEAASERQKEFNPWRRVVESPINRAVPRKKSVSVVCQNWSATSESVTRSLRKKTLQKHQPARETRNVWLSICTTSKTQVHGLVTTKRKFTHLIHKHLCQCTILSLHISLQKAMTTNCFSSEQKRKYFHSKDNLQVHFPSEAK